MRRFARHAYAVRAGYHRIDRKPVDRRALLPGLVDHVAVDGQREWHLARYDHVGQDGVAAAHRQAVARRDLPEELRAFLLAQILEQAAIPFAGFRFHAELALPSGIEQIGPAFRQILLSDRTGVVRLHEDVDELRRPAAMGGHRSEEHTSE